MGEQVIDAREKISGTLPLLERGKGDSVKEIAEYWGEATIEEIHNRVVDWAAKAKSINKRGER